MPYQRLPALGARAKMTLSDHDLLGRTAARDRTAFAALYDRYAPRAFGLILRILRNRTDAEDVLQETFLQVWAQAARFDPNRSAPDVWLLLIARSRADAGGGLSAGRRGFGTRCAVE